MTLLTTLMVVTGGLALMACLLVALWLSAAAQADAQRERARESERLHQVAVELCREQSKETLRRLVAQHPSPRSTSRGPTGPQAAAALGFLLLAAPVFAGPMVDFSAGPLGNLGTSTLTVGGVGVEAFGGSLYRRNEPNDHGFGVCGPSQDCRIGDYNEMDGSEAMILHLPAGRRWTGLWLSSVDGAEAGYYMTEYWPVGPIRFVAGQGLFSATVETRIPLDSAAPELRIWPDARLEDNDFLVWGVDLDDPSTVPEPGTFATLGLGLAWLWRRRRAAVGGVVLLLAASTAHAAPLNLVPGTPDHSQAFVDVTYQAGTFRAFSSAITDPTNTPLPFGTWELLATIAPDGTAVDGQLLLDEGDGLADLVGFLTAFGVADAGRGIVIFEFVFDLTIDTLGYGGTAGVILTAAVLVNDQGSPVDPFSFAAPFSSVGVNSRADTFGDGTVPEPATLGLLGLGLALAARRIRR